MTTCPSCAADVPAGSRFCPACGTALTETAPPAEMLKLVTILFADVVGSTARAESLHPEDVRALMTDFFAAMSDEIRAVGGTIEKFAGDAIMAVFGAPAAHEDDALRAVRAATRMLARLRTWNEQHGRALDIRIGVNTGNVIASGAVGGDLLVTGDAVNVAARLEQAADAGTILIGERTARAVRGHFELRSVDPIRLKGKAAPVDAWLVVGERESPEPRGVPGLAAPLVGRERELATLRTAWERVRSGGRPQLVTLVGEAGVGKSRLVREFVSEAGGDAKVLVGRCLPYGEAVTLAPLAEILKAEAGVLDTDSAGAAVAKIARLVESFDGELVSDSERTVAALVSTVGVSVADDPLATLDPRDLRRERVVAWRALLASTARRAPVIAVVEDIHWADTTMLDVLDELAERGDGAIFFVCPARPDLLRARPDWGGGRRSFSALPLDPLTADDSKELIARLLDVDDLPDPVRARMLERAEGNPFFLEEIVRHLVDDGLILHEGGRWRARADVVDVEIPDTVQGVILARLDLLSPEEKRVAQLAAVVGRVFWDGAVSTLAQVDDLEAVFATLRRRELVLDRLSSSIGGQAEYIFKHVLIRDVAYASLPRRERSAAHAETAAWIEETSGDRAREHAELLAHHYDAAFSYAPGEQLRRNARAWSLVGTENARRRFALEEAERLARRAVELSSADERVEALEALGDLHYVAFNGDAAYAAYRDALESAERRDVARLAGKAGLFGARWIGAALRLPPADEVAAMLDEGLAAAGPDQERERTLLLVDSGFFGVYRTDADAAEAVREALAAAERLDDPDLLSAALDLALAQEQGRGRHGEAYRITRRRAHLLQRMRDVKEIGDTTAMVAATAQYVGRFREAETGATACIERAREVDSGSYLHGLAWRVAARFALGKWDDALADQAELERVAAHDRRDLPAGYTMRAYGYSGLIHELRGNTADADRYLALGRRYVDAVRSRGTAGHRTPVVAQTFGLMLMRRGRFDDARELAPLVRHSVAAVQALELLCELVAARARWDDAAEIVAAARDEAENAEHAALPLHADRLEGRAAAAAGDDAGASALLRRSADGFELLGARWQEAWSRLLLGELTADGREAAVALDVFDELGSVREAERARAVLALTQTA